MGLAEFWVWLKKKIKYQPKLLYPNSNVQLPPEAKIRIDILGAFFPSIRWACMRYADDRELLHLVLEKVLGHLGSQDKLVLYIDGHPAEEKKDTHESRRQERQKSVKQAEAALDLLRDRIVSNKRLRRQHFQKVNKNISAAFCWALEDRTAFVEYLLKKGYHAVLCDTEADPRIAADSQPSDIVVSRDSDFLGYQSVRTIWRPVGHASHNKYLVYCKDDILTSLNLTDIQLTALACVVKNDYESNVPSFAVVSSYDIIKGLRTHQNVETLVKDYLSQPRIIRNNRSRETFSKSMEVIVHQSQTKVPDGPAEDDKYKDLCQRFESLKSMYQEQKKTEYETRKASRSAAAGNWMPRHKRHQQYNRYRTIDMPPPRQQDGSTDATRPSTYRHHHHSRYTIKGRGHPKVQEPPEIVKQYELKPYMAELERRWRESQNEKCNTGKDDQSGSKQKKTKKSKMKERADTPIESMTKAELVRSMMWQHPVVSLRVGTVSANTKHALGDGTAQQAQAQACIQDVTKQALTTKWDAQSFIGQFIEAAFHAGLTEEDKSILSTMCPPVSSAIKGSDKAEEEEEEEEVNEQEEEGDDDVDRNSTNAPYKKFYQILLAHIYSRKRLPSTVVGHHVHKLINRAAELQVTLPIQRQWANAYSTNELLSSVSQQLFIEVKKMYIAGSKDLEKKLENTGNRGLPTEPPRIDCALPAIENFLILNQATKNPHRIAPLSMIKRRYVSFGERQLIVLFWKWDVLKSKLVELIRSDKYFTDQTITPSQADTRDWSMTKSPGFILTQFLSDVGRAETAENKSNRGYRKTARMMDVASMKAHLQEVTYPDFNANLYSVHGQVLKGSIRTNGHLIQLLAFKLHELLAVRYRRLPADKMPHLMTTAIGGTDRYLTEIRNVVRSPHDVEAIWACPPQDIAVLALDLGTEGLVGSTVLLPEGVDDIRKKKRKKKRKKNRRGKRTSKKRGTRRSRSSKELQASGKDCIVPKQFDLVVKRKAVAQPTKKFEHWIESQKQAFRVGANSTITEVESNLPPLCGEGASVQGHIQARLQVEADLDAFYNQTNYIKHAWDADRAHEEEYSRVANSLLKMAGGSIGERRRDDQKVAIAIGLAKFVAKSGPPSLDGSFQDFFVRKARSLGYIVLGINEWYTSQRCPDCEEFVCKTKEWRWLYCPTCRKNWQRDVMAAKNMCKAVKCYLEHQRRPLYLQPQRADGTYPWREADDQCSTEDDDTDSEPMLIDPPGQAGPSSGDMSSSCGKHNNTVDHLKSEQQLSQPLVPHHTTATGTKTRIDGELPAAHKRSFSNASGTTGEQALLSSRCGSKRRVTKNTEPQEQPSTRGRYVSRDQHKSEDGGVASQQKVD